MTRPMTHFFADSSDPPPVGAVPNVDYPEVEQQQLPNGLTVMALTERRLPRVSIRLAIPGGKVANPAHNLAALQVGTDLIFEGTRRRTSSELAEALDRFAIQTDVDVYLESTRFFVSVLDSYLEKAFQILSEVILEPSYDPTEFEKLKVRWTSFLISERAQPRFLASERTMQALFPEHPYSRVSIPLDHVQDLTRDTLISVLERRFTPNQAFLMVAGPIVLEEAVDLATRHFSAWKPVKTESSLIPEVDELKTGRVLLVHRPHSVQSRFEVAGPGLARASSEFLCLRLANQVLGGGASSRLFMNLREDKGYTYGAYSLLRGYTRSGFYSAAADVRSDAVLDAIGQTLQELQRMRDGEPDSSEMELARAELIGDFVMRMETATSMGGLEMDRLLNQLPADYYQQYIPALQRMSAGEVLECSRQYFDPERVVITVVGDADQLFGPLQSLGKVTVYDAQGGEIDQD